MSFGGFSTWSTLPVCKFVDTNIAHALFLNPHIELKQYGNKKATQGNALDRQDNNTGVPEGRPSESGTLQDICEAEGRLPFHYS